MQKNYTGLLRNIDIYRNGKHAKNEYDFSYKTFDFEQYLKIIYISLIIITREKSSTYLIEVWKRCDENC